jgi:hypothetical protein
MCSTRAPRAAVPTRLVVAAAKLAEQADDFEVEPDEGDHDAEGTVPLHEFGCALIDALLDEVEIEDEVVLGFCKSATLEEIRSHGHVLTPGRYVERKKLRMTENRLKKR